MDFKELGSSLIHTFAQEKLIEHFNRKQLKQTLGSALELSSASLINRNVNYRSSSSLGRQHTLEIHINSVDLSDVALKVLNGKYKKCLGIRICWYFMSFESTTPIIQVKEKHVNINDTQKYTICLNDVFLSYISKKLIQFELYGTYEYKEKHLGRCEMDLRDIIYYPDEDMARDLEIMSINKPRIFKKCQNNSSMGNLTLKIRLKAYSLTEIHNSFDEIELEELYCKMSQKVSSNTLIGCHTSYVSKAKNLEKNAKEIGITSSDYSFFRNIVNSILDDDKFASQRKEESDLMIQRKETYLNRSLEEYAILSGSNTKIATTSMEKEIKIRNYDEDRNYDSAIVINVMSLYVNDKKCPLQSDEVKELYVEYSFLSRSGRDMETLSLPLLENRTIEYNFKRTFPIDNINDHSDCKVLAKLIKERKSIRFIIIEEPVEEINKFQICKEVGFAEVNLFQLVQNEENVVTDLYHVMDLQRPDEEIGYLKVRFYGIQAMRNAALKILTPPEHRFQDTEL